jgi:hypothetical protein
MIKAALASALLFVAVSVTPGLADTVQTKTTSALVLTESHIAQAKAALRLTPEQERHWPRVASALRSFARQGNGATAQLSGARRVISAAAPLLRSLDSEQRQTALLMVRSLGFGHLASAL